MSDAVPIGFEHHMCYDHPIERLVAIMGKQRGESRCILQIPTVKVWIFLIGGLFLSVGCSPPECREIPPPAKQIEEMFDDLDDRLDEVDATESQRREIMALGRKFVPKIRLLGEQTTPRTKALIDEAKKQAPDRERLLVLNTQLIDYYFQFFKNMIPIWQQGHRILTTEQRITWSKKDKKPKEPFKGSMALDGAIQLFLIQVDATDRQKYQTIKLKNRLIRRSQPLQKELDRLRIEIIEEIQKNDPDFDRMQQHLEAMQTLVMAFVTEAIDGYLAWRGEFYPGQKEILNTYLNSLRPCEPGQKP